ncbi:unnamed protein product [Darwinula stevensoni]|uniref:Aldehyde dehydrogenase domain-containing protein n=1 Tax=Darwinula stevensoni TaxID=69355 RepID=A0A7R9FT11_9CRUS|nr:unnamed protein product [Darwinula stevensoni]CAG0905061.1 unnamed protein product [Darwinula stevensoni]
MQPCGSIFPLEQPCQRTSISAQIEKLMHDAVEEGCRVIRGRRRHEKGGLFYQPTLVEVQSTDSILFREEIFGPVAAFYKFATEEEALRIANSSDKGLTGYVYTRDLAQIWRVSRGLEVGMVGVNEPIVSRCETAFGGVKESGFGVEGSRHGLQEYTYLKLLCLGHMA